MSECSKIFCNMSLVSYHIFSNIMETLALDYIESENHILFLSKLPMNCLHN